jgi:hypothetical protein
MKKRTPSITDGIPVSTVPLSGPIDDTDLDGLTPDQILDLAEEQVDAAIAHSKATGEPIWMEPFVESELQAIRDLEAEMQADTAQAPLPDHLLYT